VIVTPVDGVTITPIQWSEAPSNDAVQGQPGFMRMLGAQVSELNSGINQADQAARALAAGENVPVHDVMIAMEHARLKLQLAVEVRNRVVDAYQNLTNMQL
jgi:flagellar hook-basal body complex protein FliE